MVEVMSYTSYRDKKMYTFYYFGIYNACMSEPINNCYLGHFWDSDTKTFKTWSEMCQKEYREIYQETIKNT